MKHLLKIVIVLLCVITFPAYSQNPNYEVITSECISAYGSSSASLSGPYDSIIGWYGAGDIDVTPSKSGSTTFTSTGMGKGSITVKFMAKGSDSCSCASAASADVYKSFSLHDSIQIEGPICVSPGQTVVYSIYPIVTKNINDRIGIDSYYWNIDTMVGKPNSFVESVHYTSGDSSSVTFTVKDWDENVGPNEISVYVGRCNADNPRSRRTLSITKQAPKPVLEREEYCISYGTDTFTMRLSEVYSAVSYSWKVPVGWNIVESGADSTWVRIKPHMSAPGEVIVSAAYRNGDAIDCAIVQTFVKINRRWSNNPKIETIGCLTANQEDSIEFEISNIPSDTYVDWHFNRSWWKVIGDTSNTRVYARPLENVPLSDTTYVYELAQCEDSTYTLKHDSVITYFIPAKVEISGPQCVEENTPYTYSVDRKQGEVGPIAEVYEWRIYRKSGNSYAVANQNGATASISFPADVEKLVVTPLSPKSSCNGDTTQYAIMISPTPPGGIVWVDPHCLAAGKEDSVTLKVANPLSTQTYSWNVEQTHNWRLIPLSDNSDSVKLKTTGAAGLDSIAVYVDGGGICGETERKKIGFETNEVGFIIERKTNVGFFWLDFTPISGYTFSNPSYYWYINNQLVATGSTYYVNMNQPDGNVTLVVKDENNCEYSYTYIVGNRNANTLRKNNVGRNTKDKLKLYPNPAQDVTKIEFPIAIEDTRIYIYAADGHLIYSATTNEKQISIPISNFAEGTYPVIVQQLENKMGDLLIIKH